MEPVLIADYQCITGEGPLWHPDERRLYWVDIPTGRMFRYDPATGAHEQCYSGPVVGGFTLQADGKLLLFMDKGAIRVWQPWRHRSRAASRDTDAARSHSLHPELRRSLLQPNRLRA